EGVSYQNNSFQESGNFFRRRSLGKAILGTHRKGCYLVDSIKPRVKKWNAAIEAIRSAFAPQKRPHDIYLEIFAKKQTSEPIDEFVCEKRALLAQVPTKRHKEDEQLDMIYGLLKIQYKKDIAREDLKTFDELLQRGRHIENLLEKAADGGIEERKALRCTFCGKREHAVEVRRKRLAEIKKEAMATDNVTSKDQIKCYGCGAPGVYRSRCGTCKNKESPPKPVAFYTMETTIKNQSKIPTIEIVVNGENGYAHIDTAARTSIAAIQIAGTKRNTICGMHSRNNCRFRLPYCPRRKITGPF
ncbi:unnamed protein product, partial [Arctia plantaginis]